MKSSQKPHGHALLQSASWRACLSLLHCTGHYRTCQPPDPKQLRFYKHTERLAERETLLHRLGSKLNRIVLNSCGNPIIRSGKTRDFFAEPGFFANRAIHTKSKTELLGNLMVFRGLPRACWVFFLFVARIKAWVPKRGHDNKKLIVSISKVPRT